MNPLIEALDAWTDWLDTAPVVVAGDFNIGGWWGDIRKGPMSHFPILERLGSMGLRSAYHVDRSIDQGIEEEPTLWHSGGGAYMVDHASPQQPGRSWASLWAERIRGATDPITPLSSWGGRQAGGCGVVRGELRQPPC